MPPVIKITDKNELVPTSSYPYAKFHFETFNPVQSSIYDFHDKEVNVIIASSTSSGKTAIAEMFLSYEIRKRGGKGLYLAPMRSLAQEKLDEWTTPPHHFSDLNICICTGDYRLTESRRAELENADLIIMTNEMLSHQARSIATEKIEFLSKIKVLVSDEVHLLGTPSRGDHAEVGLMKLTGVNPDVKLVLLSATVPNVEEIADWVSYTLTQKDTVLLKSKYRPCPLITHYEQYDDSPRKYEEKELNKVMVAMDIVDEYPDDKFLIFAHTKKTGELMRRHLENDGIKCEFHSADLDKEGRLKAERQFKEDKKLRVLVATSTLAWGVNMPARRVIILGVHRGLDEVASYDVAQEIGRAGRPQYDPAGDAYILLPEGNFDLYKLKYQKLESIRSQMLEIQGGKHKILAFHIVSEIYQGNIKSKDDVRLWYKRSLAHFQAQELDDDVVDKTIDSLKKCGAVWEEDDLLTATNIGKIASLFYYSPYDVSDLKKNFTYIFNEKKENSDLYLAVALGNIDSLKFGIVSKAEREEMSMFQSQVNQIFGRGNVWDAAIKASFIYYQLLNGNVSPTFISLSRNLQHDFPRVNQVLKSIDNFGAKWDRFNWFKELQLRVSYGVKGELVYLCQLPGVGKVRATKLWNAGLKSLQDVASNPAEVRKSLGLKPDKIEAILAEARKLVMVGDD